MVLGQQILRMRRRHLVWNTSNLRWIETVVFQHSVPYRRTLSTLLLKILILVWTLRLVVLHTGINLAKAWLTLLNLALIFWSQSPVVVTLVTKLANSSTSSRCFPSIMTLSFTLAFFLRIWVFLVLTLRPVVLAVLLRRSCFVGHPGVCWI